MSNKLTKFMALAALTAAVGAWANQAQASLTYYLAIDGSPTVQTIDFSALTGGSVTLGIYADITGSNAGLRIGGGSLVVTNYDGTAVTAGFTGTTLAAGFDGIDGTPVNLAGSQFGAGYTVSAFGGTVTNWGGSTADPSGYFYAVSEGGPVTPVFGNTVKLGTATFNVGAMEAGKVLSLNFEIRNRPTAPDQIWFEEYTAPVSPNPAPGGAITDQSVGAVIGVKTTAFTITNAGGPPTGIVVPPNLKLTADTETPSLTIAGATDAWTGTLDIDTYSLVIHSDSANVANVLSTVTNQVINGLSTGPNGYWDGTGIQSSAAATNGDETTCVAVIRNEAEGSPLYESWKGFEVGVDDVLVRYTYWGDADMNGYIDSEDYTLINSGFYAGGELTGWLWGDFDYSGTIDSEDYTLINSAFYGQGAPLFAGLVAPTAVPEPATLSVLGLGLLGVMCRRSRK